MNKESKGLRDLTIQELHDKTEGLRRELFSLRLQGRTSHVKDNSQYKKLRKGIARALTIKTEKEEAEGANSGK